MVIITTIMLVYIHEFKFYIYNRDFAKNVIKSVARSYRKVVLYMVFFFGGGGGGLLIIERFAQKLLEIVIVVIFIVAFAGMFWLLLSCGLHYMKDCMWLRAHSVEIKHMHRTQLESNLESIYFDRTKHKYLELLLLQNIELMGRWSDDGWP